MFQRHKYLNYQGYAFPWYIAAIWVCFLVAGVAYLVKYILLES